MIHRLHLAVLVALALPLCARAAAQGSDSCTTPQAISGAGPHFFDTNPATTGSQGQNEALCNQFGTSNLWNDVWFTWTSPCTASVTVSMCQGAFFDSKLAVYAGAGCPVASAIACDDDACCNACASELIFSATAGQSYTFQIGSFPGGGTSAGTFTTICPAPPPVMTSFCHPGFLGVPHCPCGNDSATAGFGCRNSGPSADGALLTGGGTASLASDSFVLLATGETSSVTSVPLTIFLQGDSFLPSATSFGDGMRCVGGTLKRIAFKYANAGNARYPNFAAGDPSISSVSSAVGSPISPGQHRYYMAYYRDPDTAFCPPWTFDTTQAGDVLWNP